MSKSREDLKKIIEEELGGVVKEISLNPFNWFKKDKPKSEEPADAESAPQEEPEEPDNDCGTDIYGDPKPSGEDIYALANKIFKNLSPKDLNAFEQFRVGPMSLLRDIGRAIKDNPKGDASDISPFVDAGSRYKKHGKELSFRYLGNALSNALKRGTKYQFGSDGPCVDGGELGTAISFAYGEAEKLEKTFAGTKPERDVDHLLSRHEGKIRKIIKNALEEMKGK